MSPKGRIQAIYPEGLSSVYNYICRGEEGQFSAHVEWRCHRDILEGEDEIIRREIQYEDGIDPPVLKFLD